MPRAIRGVLVRCDPSIKALILQVDSQRHDIVVEELDDTHLVIDQSKVQAVKDELNRLLSQNIYNAIEDESILPIWIKERKSGQSWSDGDLSDLVLEIDKWISKYIQILDKYIKMNALTTSTHRNRLTWKGIGLNYYHFSIHFELL